MVDYLRSINLLSDHERGVLMRIGAPTPLALESVLEAAPEVYERFLGKSRLHELLTALDRMITPEERDALKAVGAEHYPLGVDVDYEPPAVSKTSLHEERDRLYDEIRQLKESGDESPTAKQRLKLLEVQLNTLLKREQEKPAA